MTYQDPEGRMRSAYSGVPRPSGLSAEDEIRRTPGDAARRDGWSPGNIVATIAVLAIIVAAIAYFTSVSSTTTATGPSTTQSAPSTWVHSPASSFSIDVRGVASPRPRP